MLKFLVKVPGHAPYHGIFAGQRQAAADAERRYPAAPPATTICITAANAQPWRAHTRGAA